MNKFIKTVIGILALSLSSHARAEVTEINVAQQYGTAFLPLMVMEKHKLVEKHAEALGLPGVKVNWVKVVGPSVMNDGLISGTIHFASTGAPSLITLWDKTRNNVGIKGVAAMTNFPLYLVSKNPDVKTIKDFTAKDKIALVSVKISIQAILLQMAAAQAFGEENYAKLDPLTITLAHPDAVLALTNNTAGINAHFGSPPFYEQEMKLPGVHLVTDSTQILGGPATTTFITASSKFRDANPKAYKAFFEGLSEAISTINRDKRAAAQIYLDASKDTKNSVDDIVNIIEAKDYEYTLRPLKVMKTAAFMEKIGLVKQAPKSVDELFFPEISGLKGD